MQLRDSHEICFLNLFQSILNLSWSLDPPLMLWEATYAQPKSHLTDQQKSKTVTTKPWLAQMLVLGAGEVYIFSL